MSVDPKVLKEFLASYEAARKAFEDKDNENENSEIWGAAWYAVDVDDLLEPEEVDQEYATIAYLIISAISRGHTDSRPRTWLLDVLPHLLVQLKLEESNEQ